MAAAPAAAGSGAGRGRRAAATVAAWGGWGGRPRPGNILLQLRQGQLTGRGLARAVQFTETFLTERDKQSKWSGIPQLLLKLYATSHLHSDFVECQNILKEISPLLSMEAMAFVTEERKLTQETTYPNTYIFDLFGGVDLLVEILMRPTISIRGQKLKISDEMSKDCLSILYNTCVCVSTPATGTSFISLPDLQCLRKEDLNGGGRHDSYLHTLENWTYGLMCA